jgi:hypothetical protein
MTKGTPPEIEHKVLAELAVIIPLQRMPKLLKLIKNLPKKDGSYDLEEIKNKMKEKKYKSKQINAFMDWLERNKFVFDDEENDNAKQEGDMSLLS